MSLHYNYKLLWRLIMIKNPVLIDRMKASALHSPSAYKICAIALNKKGEILGRSINTMSRWNSIESYKKSCLEGTSRAGTGVHAERRLIERYKGNIKTIIICRVGKRGDLLPIEPCSVCKKVAQKFNIKIVSISNNE